MDQRHRSRGRRRAPARGPALTPSADDGRRRDHRGLLAALVVDNVGSGMFLPLTVVFIVRSIGLTVGAAGALLTAGTLIGLLVPASVARIVDRVGPRTVVASAMVVQACGLLAYLMADGVALTFVAAALVAAGTQTFYSALFALISQVAGAGPKDHPFAVVATARAGAFGAGSVLAGVLLTLASTTGLRIALGLDALSFVVAAALLRFVVRPGDRLPRAAGPRPGGRGAPDRPFLVLIVAVALLAVVSDLFLVGLPVYALDVLHTAGWVPGTCLAVLTLATSTLTVTVVRRTAALSRIAALGIGAGCYLAWCLLTACAPALPAGWATAWLLGSTLVLVAGYLCADTRANALAEAAAPPESRGRHLAHFQYAFTFAGLLAPLVIALFAVADWLPWLVVAACALAAGCALPWLARALPPHAVLPSRSVTDTHPAADAGTAGATMAG